MPSVTRALPVLVGWGVGGLRENNGNNISCTDFINRLGTRKLGRNTNRARTENKFVLEIRTVKLFMQSWPRSAQNLGTRTVPSVNEKRRTIESVRLVYVWL